jgi:predicted transcriptional regulator of viral defense system
MAKPSHLLLAKSDILELFATASSKVYAPRQLGNILAQHRRSWHLPDSARTPDFIAFLTKYGDLRAQKLRSSIYNHTITRYTWGKASPYEVALSIKPHAYLSHGTAASLHGLNTYDRKTIYMNAEQSKKPSFNGTLTQQGIDRAFTGNQRASQLAYIYGTISIVQLSGKHTNRLGVEEIIGESAERLATTSLERTLVDIVVRPTYAGGPAQILKTYRAAKNRVSAERLLMILKKLDHAYPYHQTIGFLMEKAGYPKTSYEQFRALGLDYDFYLAHRLHEAAYSTDWRVHYPPDLQ